MGNRGYFRIRTLIVIVWAVAGSASARQSTANHGMPYFHVFSTDDYPSEQQIFDALEWHDGTMIFANAGGLVQHADDEWEIFARFDASFLSELEASRFDSTIIWAGSYSNIGYFDPLPIYWPVKSRESAGIACWVMYSFGVTSPSEL